MALQRKNLKAGAVLPANTTTLPAPSAGMDGRITLAAGNPDIATYCYNILSDETGMKVRNGYGEHCIGLQNSIATGIKTLIPYDSPTVASTDQRLFAVSNEGIWDVTTFDTPVFKIAFPSTINDAGVGVYQHYVTDAAASLLFYADAENGLYTYTKATDTWAATTGITGIAAADIVFVSVHKQRIWFALRDSADAWYLPIGAIAGAATKFQFGNKFKRGGYLVGVYNWTIDGGEGIDDYLVGISSAGDVLPYKGSDPEAVTGDLWALKGAYYVGEVVGGTRCASEFGGDLHILSSQGVTPLTQLLQGVDVSIAPDGIGVKTAFYLRPEIRQYRDNFGWSINYFPSISYVLISTPKRLNNTYIQYAYDKPMDTFGWWRGVPMLCSVEWRGQIYIGTEDDRVLIMNTDLDEVKITPVAGQTNGDPIDFSALFAFMPLDSGGMFKRGVSIRPDFISPNKMAYQTKFLYDYQIQTFSSTVTVNDEVAGRWDSGLWDTAIWGSSIATNRSRVVGGAGIGRRLAVAVQGTSTANTYLMSYDVLWNVGGMM